MGKGGIGMSPRCPQQHGNGERYNNDSVWTFRPQYVAYFVGNVKFYQKSLLNLIPPVHLSLGRIFNSSSSSCLLFLSFFDASPLILPSLPWLIRSGLWSRRHRHRHRQWPKGLWWEGPLSQERTRIKGMVHHCCLCQTDDFNFFFIFLCWCFSQT